MDVSNQTEARMQRLRLYGREYYYKHKDDPAYRDRQRKNNALWLEKSRAGMVVAKGMTRKEYERHRYSVNKIKLLEKRYNLPAGSYNKMLLAQNSSCKICGVKDNLRHKKNLFCIDHNHETGEVRGLLCGRCNSVIGLSDENINILSNVIKYIKETN